MPTRSGTLHKPVARKLVSVGSITLVVALYGRAAQAGPCCAVRMTACSGRNAQFRRVRQSWTSAQYGPGTRNTQWRCLAEAETPHASTRRQTAAPRGMSFYGILTPPDSGTDSCSLGLTAC